MFRLLKLTKPYALEKLQEDEFSETDKILYEAGHSSKVRNFFMDIAPKMKEIVNNLKIEANIMKTAKNDLFSNLSELHKLEKEFFKLSVETLELNNFLKYWDQHESDHKFSIFSILEIGLTESSFVQSESAGTDSQLGDIPLHNILEIN